MMLLRKNCIRKLNLLEAFLHRRDAVLIQSSRGARLRANITDSTKATLLLLSHLEGYTVTIDVFSAKKDCWFAATDKFRVGSYLTPPGGAAAREMDIDWDGESHGRRNPLEEALAAYDTAIWAGLQPLLEKSGSGTGWHLRVITDMPVPCETLKKLGRALAPDSAVEVFPKASSVAPGDFGSAVWLPLWHRSDRGGGYFYTDRLIPHIPSLCDIHRHTEDEIKEAITQLRTCTSTPIRAGTVAPTIPTQFAGHLPQSVRVFAMECLDIAIEKAGAGDGRHDTAVWLSIRLRDNGIPKQIAHRILANYQQKVDGLGHHPFSWKEAQSILLHTYKKPARAMDRPLLVTTFQELQK